jgi:C1A family cysteine protease
MSYPSSFLNGNFEWLDPDNTPRSASGHCVLAVGYNDARQAIHIQDSHGSGQFETGSWWMGYRVVDSSIVQDVYGLLP